MSLPVINKSALHEVSGRLARAVARRYSTGAINTASTVRSEEI